MSAVLEHGAEAVAADQAALPGIAAESQTPATPPPARAAAIARQLDESEPIKCVFMGRLAEHARLVDDTSGQGRVLLQVLLHQHIVRHPQAWPVLAVWDYPRELGLAYALDRATALVQHLTAGADVVVLGRGVEAYHHHGEPCLRVLQVLGLKLEQALRPAPPPAGPDLFEHTDGAPEGATPC